VRLTCTSFRISLAARDVDNEASSVDLFVPRDELELDAIVPSTIENRQTMRSAVKKKTNVHINDLASEPEMQSRVDHR